MSRIPRLPSLGDRVRFARKTRGLSQEKTAKLALVDKGTISRWERNEITADQALGSSLRSVAAVLDVPWSWLRDGGPIPKDLLAKPAAAGTLEKGSDKTRLTRSMEVAHLARALTAALGVYTKACRDRRREGKSDIEIETVEEWLDEMYNAGLSDVAGVVEEKQGAETSSAGDSPA